MGDNFDKKDYYTNLSYNQKIEFEITSICWKPLSVYEIGKILDLHPRKVKEHVYRMVRKGMLNVIQESKAKKYIRNLNLWTDV